MRNITKAMNYARDNPKLKTMYTVCPRRTLLYINHGIFLEVAFERGKNSNVIRLDSLTGDQKVTGSIPVLGSETFL